MCYNKDNSIGFVYKNNSIGFILDRCERGTISNDPPATIIGLELPRQ